MDGTHQGIDGLPTLARGAHPDARSQACVMEYAALLAGERHTDRPAAVHPLLVQVCQVTNDVISDEARRDLVRLAPALIGTAVPPSTAGNASGEVLLAAARVLGTEAEVRALVADHDADAPAVAPRLDPGDGGGTAVLDRPTDVSPFAGTERRACARHTARGAVYRGFTMMLATRSCDQEAVDTLEAMVHAVREALGRPEVSTARPWPRDADGELARP